MEVNLVKVLVVDDDARLREALEVGLQLQWEDAQIISTADGEAGLDLFFSRPA
jgi:DNA-binding response OmpR family regulator